MRCIYTGVNTVRAVFTHGALAALEVLQHHGATAEGRVLQHRSHVAARMHGFPAHRQVNALRANPDLAQ